MKGNLLLHYGLGVIGLASLLAICFAICGSGSAQAQTNAVSSSAPNTVGLWSNSVERLHIDSNGNVGIATTTSPNPLTVVTSSNVVPGIQIRHSGAFTGDAAILGFRVSASDSTTDSAEIRSIRLNSPQAGDAAIAFLTQTNLVLTEAMRIDSTGNVGIGTTAPNASAVLDLSAKTTAMLLPVGTTGQEPTCNAAMKGGFRFNSTSGAPEACNGTSWMQFATQTVGSTTNVTASGPPVNANTYVPSSVTCNYTPAFGSCSNIDDGVWPANSTSDNANASCLQFINAGTFSSPQQAIIIDLGASKTIGNVYGSMDQNNILMNLGISFSTDNVNYTSSASLSSGNPTGQGFASFSKAALSPNVTARYIRLTNTGSFNNGSTTGGFTSEMTVCQFAVGP